jgi:iron(III) transport system ATP-binding protein
VSLAPVPEGWTADAEPLACVGEVVDMDFGGATCTLAVALLDGAGHGAPLLLRRSSSEAPAVGSIVRLTVAGTAHVFPA